jgi:hypothetical protein
LKVHIVLPRFENWNRILPRKAQALKDATGWGLSPRVDPRADLNYFFPYMAIQPVGTRTAAYFTHREGTQRQAKADIWDETAARLDLRLTSSKHNLPYLSPFGKTTLVTPPLDREKFKPTELRGLRDKPVAGTSGYVYPGGRKGEALLAALRDSKSGRRCNWQATGRGWPVPTRGYRWEEMEKFYQGLDVYICTSLNEGVGYGPLEALSCGVPVVIPWGVGVFDDLPSMEGITRYRAGDAADLILALERALEQKPDGGALRAVTEPYSVKAWAAEHVAAFESLLKPKGKAKKKEPIVVADENWRSKAGLYVVAFGEPSRKCAVRCIDSFKRYNPGIPVLLCAERALGPEDLLVTQPDIDIGARLAKIKVYDLAPPEWQYILYLDADTETTGTLDPLYQFLADGWEMTICKNPQRFHLAANMGRKDNTTECQETFKLWGSDQMMQWNGGVFGFRRCEAMRRLFTRWYDEWQVWGKRDQGALLRALWHEPVRAMWLGNEWNLVEVYDPIERCAGILHRPMQARRWSGIVDARSDSPEAWLAVDRWQAAHLKEAKR